MPFVFLKALKFEAEVEFIQNKNPLNFPNSFFWLYFNRNSY